MTQMKNSDPKGVHWNHGTLRDDSAHTGFKKFKQLVQDWADANDMSATITNDDRDGRKA